MAEQDNTCAPVQDTTCPVPPPGGISALWKQEDWLAVWVGFFIIALILFFNFSKTIDLSQVAPTYKWTTGGQITSLTSQWNEAIDPMIQNAEKAGEQGTANRLKALKEAIAKGDRKEIGAAADRVDRLGGLAGALGKEISTHAKAIPEKIL